MSNIITNKKQILDVVLKIKEAMRKNRLEVRHIAEITGLKKYTVTNVLMGESKRFDYISLIADALNLPLSNNDNDKTIINCSLYSIACEACLTVLKDSKESFTKYQIEQFIFNTYLNSKKLNISDVKILIGYAHAIMENKKI